MKLDLNRDGKISFQEYKEPPVCSISAALTCSCTAVCFLHLWKLGSFASFAAKAVRLRTLWTPKRRIWSRNQARESGDRTKFLSGERGSPQGGATQVIPGVSHFIQFWLLMCAAGGAFVVSEFNQFSHQAPHCEQMFNALPRQWQCQTSCPWAEITHIIYRSDMDVSHCQCQHRCYFVVFALALDRARRPRPDPLYSFLREVVSRCSVPAFSW